MPDQFAKNASDIRELTKEPAVEIKVMPEEFYFKKVKIAKQKREEGSAAAKSPPWLIIAMVVVVVILMGVAAYLFIQSLGKEQPASAPQTPANTNAAASAPANVPANVPVNTPPANANTNIPPAPICGNNLCEAGEDSTVCPADCPSPLPAVPEDLLPATDTDDDSLTDVEEALYETNPGNLDTDSDGYNDGLELVNLYNPTGFAPQRIEETALVKVYTNPSYNYSIFYPAQWIGRSLDTTNQEVIFTSATGEFVEVIAQENKDDLPLLDWYLSISPGVSASEIGTVSTKNGMVGIKSLDGLTVYFEAGGNIYAINYNTGAKTELNYNSTFEMMYKSFKIGT